MTMKLLASMTGFARKSLSLDWGSVSWEIRSVNSRYLELYWRLPEALRDMELTLRDAIGSILSRGKVECNLRLQTQGSETVEITLNEALLQQWQKTAQAVESQLPPLAPYKVTDVMKWPDMLQISTMPTAEIRQSITILFNETLTELLECRQREGTAIKEFLQSRSQQIQRLLQEVQALLVGQIDRYHQQLQRRCEALAADLDPDRLAQEVALIAQRSDVTEELDRLATHCEEVLRILEKGGVCGRRLDFLMQELNREANTLGSKSTLLAQTQAVIEIKVLIEQMREQIQNLE